MENIALRSLQILYMFVLREEKVTDFAAISTFYNISPPNFAILLILRCSF